MDKSKVALFYGPRWRNIATSCYSTSPSVHKIPKFLVNFGAKMCRRQTDYPILNCLFI